MRIHSDKLTVADILAAAKVARADVDSGPSVHGSRKRARGFEVILSGESRRRQNGGSNYAATWDQWGVFLAELFAIDPEMACPYHTDAENFANRTSDRFGAPEVVMGSGGYMEEFKAYGWPKDAHGDHRFTFAGTPGEQSALSARPFSDGTSDPHGHPIPANPLRVALTCITFDTTHRTAT